MGDILAGHVNNCNGYIRNTNVIGKIIFKPKHAESIEINSVFNMASLKSCPTVVLINYVWDTPYEIIVLL